MQHQVQSLHLKTEVMYRSHVHGWQLLEAAVSLQTAILIAGCAKRTWVGRGYTED